MRRWLTYPANRRFRWLWWSQTVSLFGSQVSLVAIPLLAAITLHADAFQMGLLVAVETGVYLLISVPAGVTVDRVDRHRLLLATNLARGAVLLTVPLGAVQHWLTLPFLFLVSAGIGLFSAIFDIAYQSYLPELLASNELIDGNQRVELSESAARTLGPGFAGALIAVCGGAVAVTVDALSYLVASGLLLGARKHADVPVATRDGDAAPPTAAQPAPNEKLAAERPLDRGGMSAGFKIVLSDRALRDTAVSTAIFNLASSAILAVFILFAARDLGLNPTAIGAVLGLGNIGFVVGALTVGFVTNRLGIGWTLTVAGLLGALGTVLLPFATGAMAVIFLCAGRFAGAVAIPWFNVNARALRQGRAPLATLGRVNSVFRLIDWGTLPLGALIGGWLGTAFSLHTTLAFGAVLGIASAAWLVASPIRRARGLEMHRPLTSWGAVARGTITFGHFYRPLRMVARVTAFGDLEIRWPSLAIGGFALQLALFLPPVNVFGTTTPALYVLSCIAVLACVLVNLRIPGMAVMAVGGLSNLLAIVFNGGFMPVAAEAARAAGQGPPTGYVTTIEMTDPTLKPLTDIIVVAWPTPLANVYSIGDVLIFLGLLVTAVWLIRRPAPARLTGPADAADPNASGNRSAVRVGT